MKRFIRNSFSLVIGAIIASSAVAQPPVHYLHRADQVPGTIGQDQLQRGGPLRGYYQPVEVRGPKGSFVSLATEGTFPATETNLAAAGMLIGEVYRLRVANIPDLGETEIYPSIEVVNRLYPPPGQATRFPIPIELTQEDLAFAARGKFVMRVIYLEDPERAVPFKEIEDQRFSDASPGADPLKTADTLGRPMAILRMGSRTPDLDPQSGRFLFDSPSLLLYERPAAETPRNSGIETPPPTLTPNTTRNTPRFPAAKTIR